MSIIDHLDLQQTHRALIEQACDGSERVFLAPMDKGLSGATLWQARWVIPETGQMSELHVFKIAPRSQLLHEQRNIEKYVSVIDNIPNVVLYPRIPSGSGDDELGLLRQRFAGGSSGRAISLRQFLMSLKLCPDSATAASVLGQLYEQNLARWHGRVHHHGQVLLPDKTSDESLARDLWWWNRKIDLQQAADEIGASALDSSLRAHAGMSLQDIIAEVNRITSLRFEKKLGVIHGDMHAQNVLVDSENQLHIIDFGATCVGWRAADFLMMECALKFTTSPANAFLDDLLEIDVIAEQQWGREAAVFAHDLQNRCYGRDLAIIAASVCTVRRFAERYGVFSSPEDYRAGLIVLTAAMASYTVLVNRNYVFHSLAKQVKMLDLQAPMVKRHDRVRCVGLFGPSGSGKTTVAENIAERYATAVVVEAFRDIIEPMLVQRHGELPSLNDVASMQSHEGPLARRVSLPLRRRSRDLFHRLSTELGDSWLAALLEEWRVASFPDRLVVVSGLRGVETARALQREGWLIVYLDAPAQTLIERQANRDGLTFEAAKADHDAEEEVFHTTEIRQLADLLVDVGADDVQQVVRTVLSRVSFSECRKCVNTDFNPWVKFTKDGYCQTCADFARYWSRQKLDEEFAVIQSVMRGKRGNYDAMVGMSGGKDSTATAWHLKEELGLRVLGFTFDLGYYPSSIFTRAKQVAELLGIDHEVIDIRGYIEEFARESYRRTADAFDNLPRYSRSQLLDLYLEGRRHYRIDDRTVLPFLRTCQLCRKTVIRAYYAEARKRDIDVVFLGINEWAGLSAEATHATHSFSATRELRPQKNQPPVHVVHLPYLLGTTLSDVKTILRGIEWQVPPGEELVETNANSCLFAAAAEYPLRKALGFHPDSSRLAREVTVGFLPKEDAIRALNKRRVSRHSVREILEMAGIV